MASVKSSTCAMGTLCVKHTKFVWMLWSIYSASTPMMSSPLLLCLWWGKPSSHRGPISAYTWQFVSMCRHTKTCLFSQYIKKHKKFNNSKNLKRGFGIRYLYYHMLLLVVGACPDLPENLFPHGDNHWWQRSAAATMQRSQLGRGQTPYLRPVCA